MNTQVFRKPNIIVKYNNDIFIQLKIIIKVQIQKILKLSLYSQKLQQKMFKKLASYSLRMRQTRQKYYSLLRRRLIVERTRIVTNMRRKIFRGVLFTSIGATAYYFGNQMYSQHLEKVKMKKKLMKAYPGQTYIISFEEDPMKYLQEVEVINTEEEKDVKKLDNHHCLYFKQDLDEAQAKQLGFSQQQLATRRHQIKKIKQKLGENIIIFSPKSFDELCHAIQRCNKYRHRAIVGSYPIPQTDDKTRPLSFFQIKQTLQKISQPIIKKKYLVIDLSQFNSIEVDEINDIMIADTGVKCEQVNRVLQAKGYQTLFQPIFSQNSLYDIIVNNLPLVQNQFLVNRLQNLSLVAADGKRFKSSTQVQTFGQIPNLTPLFLGTGGVFAIPAKANIKLLRKTTQKLNVYSIQSQNLSDLVIKLRQLSQYLSSNRINYTLSIQSPTKIQIKTNKPLQLSKYKNYKQQQLPQHLNNNPDYILSINNKILQKIILNPYPQLEFTYQNNLLSICSNNKEDEIRKIVSMITVQGGVLVWCKNQDFYREIKERTDLPETGAELMRKIVQIREGIDKKHILHAHSRYQKYFQKGFFRKITQFFW